MYATAPLSPNLRNFPSGFHKSATAIPFRRFQLSPLSVPISASMVTGELEVRMTALTPCLFRFEWTRTSRSGCVEPHRAVEGSPDCQGARGALSRRLGTCDLLGGPVARRMKKIDYDGYRFPPAVIQQAVWLYFRFTLSFRDVEDLLAERGMTVSYETVRRWVNYFGPMIAADLRKRRPKPYKTWHLRARNVACGCV